MSLENLSKQLLNMAMEINKGKEAKNFLKKESNKLKAKTLSRAKSEVKNKTGIYLKSIKSGKPYEYEGDLAVRTYSTAPHAHLIEYGHIVKSRDGKEHGFKKGHYIFENSAKDFEKTFEDDIENFIDEMLIKHELG
ncbi:MAG: HK97 gp10 family phage protein [Fusobacteriaceae bacterium]